MAFIVTEQCIRCKYTECIEVCPVDCFHEGPNMLVIDPDECIDCGLCESECPVNAIKAEYPISSTVALQEGEDLLQINAELAYFTQINAEFSKQWPVITQVKPAPADAEQWKNVPGKKQYLHS